MADFPVNRNFQKKKRLNFEENMITEELFGSICRPYSERQMAKTGGF